MPLIQHYKAHLTSSKAAYSNGVLIDYTATWEDGFTQSLQIELSIITTLTVARCINKHLSVANNQSVHIIIFQLWCISTGGAEIMYISRNNQQEMFGSENWFIPLSLCRFCFALHGKFDPSFSCLLLSSHKCIAFCNNSIWCMNNTDIMKIPLHYLIHFICGANCDVSKYFRWRTNHE